MPSSSKVPSEVDRRKLFDSLSPGWDRRVRMDEWLTGISRLRRQLCGRAEGDVLEVGCGTARNFSYYNSYHVGWPPSPSRPARPPGAYVFFPFFAEKEKRCFFATFSIVFFAEKAGR